LPGYVESGARGISDNGRVVVGGMANIIPEYRAFFWTPEHGTQDINTHLSAHGVNLSWIVLTDAYAVSGDGSIVLCDGSGGPYLVRIDGDYLGLANPTNVFASLASVAAGSSASIVASLPISSLPGVDFRLGNIPPAGDGGTGGSWRAWSSGTVLSDRKMSGEYEGISGGAGLTYYMTNGISIGGGAFYGQRSVRGLWGSKQRLDSASLGLFAGYAPAVTGIRLSLGSMFQTYDLHTTRNYPNGAGMASSKGSGSGWNFGLTGHAGWVFGLTNELTVQPFVEYTRQWSKMPGYTESGGPFPVKYDTRTYSQNTTRIGADAQWDVAPNVNLQAWLAWNHRFEKEGPATSGQIMGWQTFNLTGEKLKQNWGDTGVGVRWRVTDSTSLGARLGFGINNKNSGLPDTMFTTSISIDF
jgi:probable HAF family extracellular repeat protein